MIHQIRKVSLTRFQFRWSGSPCERQVIVATVRNLQMGVTPALDAMREGYQTYPVADAVGGTSPAAAHQAGLDRIALAGGKPTSVVQVGCELQRDWGRQGTAEGFTQILFGGDRPLAGASTEPAGKLEFALGR